MNSHGAVRTITKAASYTGVTTKLILPTTFNAVKGRQLILSSQLFSNPTAYGHSRSDLYNTWTDKLSDTGRVVVDKDADLASANQFTIYNLAPLITKLNPV
ncbi:hypothetical protein [Paenibacillus graminis]|uniref:hypothetical protein n=1 Tax=Paenibacillus graminis TaxID=189425 RepID=UPI002DBA9FDF|nr:hypothetical protein [Paenibacillus graminis]MEC0168240.1 hypothetical protein [Paenibacillus graminis]